MGIARHAALYAIVMMPFLLGGATVRSQDDGYLYPSGVWRSPDRQTYMPDNRARVEDDGRRFTPSGVPFEKPITVRAGDGLFHVPAGYLQAWYRPEVFGKEGYPHAIKEGLDFLFWMPSLRPLEVRTEPPLVRSQPREYGRPPPGPNEFVVWVQWARVQREDAYISPLQQIRNLVAANTRLTGTTPNIETVDGLEWMNFGPKSLPGLREYRNASQAQPHLLLQCFHPGNNSPNPMCYGDVHYSADDIAFRVSFSKRKLRDWRQIVDATHEMLSQWRQERL